MIVLIVFLCGVLAGGIVTGVWIMATDPVQIVMNRCLAVTTYKPQTLDEIMTRVRQDGGGYVAQDLFTVAMGMLKTRGHIEFVEGIIFGGYRLKENAWRLL